MSSLVASIFSLKCEEQFSAQRESGGRGKGDSKRRGEGVDGGSSGALVLNMWFLDRQHQHHLGTFLKCSF